MKSSLYGESVGGTQFYHIGTPSERIGGTNCQDVRSRSTVYSFESSHIFTCVFGPRSPPTSFSTVPGGYWTSPGPGNMPGVPASAGLLAGQKFFCVGDM